MIIAKNKVVSLLYELHENTLAGELIEKVPSEQPFKFLFGAGGLIPEFEQNIDGLKVGDTFEFGIESANAYGLVDEKAIVNLPKDIFVIDGELATELLEVGKVIPMRNEGGHLIHGLVKEVATDTVKMDFNHPMAGKNLFFKGEVVEIREATPTEISHGHVHGPGGHQH